MSTYPIKKLSEICKIKTGKKDVNEGNPNGEFPFFTCAREHTFSDSYSFDMEALLIAGNGDVGHVQYYKGKFEAYQRTYILHDFSSSTSVQYLFLYLHSFLRETVSKQKLGNTMPYIKLGMLTEFQIPLPPISVQNEIVAKLDVVLASIDESKTKTEQAHAATRELWESTLEEAFRGDDGLEEKRFDEVCVLQRGFDLPTHARNKGNFPLVSSNGITDRIDLWKVKAPGVVTGRSGTIGNIHFVEEDFWPLNTSLYIKNFHGNNEKCIYYFLKQFNLGKYSSGAGVPTLNRNNVHCEMVRFPPISEQSHIVDHLDAVRAETDRLATLYEQKLADLDELRRSVLQEAFA